jgi:hypothetical protein
MDAKTMTHANTRGICAVCQKVYDLMRGDSEDTIPDKRQYMARAEAACLAEGIEPLRKTIERQYGHRRAWHATRALAKLNTENQVK